MNSVLLDLLTTDELPTPADLETSLAAVTAAGTPWLSGVE